MRWDEQYRNASPAGQMQLRGLGLDGEQDVEEARAWILANREAWQFMVDTAMRYARRDGTVPINFLVQYTRIEKKVSIKNGLAPALARIMERSYPSTLAGAFRKHASKSDGYV